MTEQEMKDAVVNYILYNSDYEYMDLFDFFDTDDRELIHQIANLIDTAKIEVSWP